MELPTQWSVDNKLQLLNSSTQLIFEHFKSEC